MPIAGLTLCILQQPALADLRHLLMKPHSLSRWATFFQLSIYGYFGWVLLYLAPVLWNYLNSVIFRVKEDCLDRLAKQGSEDHQEELAFQGALAIRDPKDSRLVMTGADQTWLQAVSCRRGGRSTGWDSRENPGRVFYRRPITSLCMSGGVSARLSSARTLPCSSLLACAQRYLIQGSVTVHITLVPVVTRPWCVLAARLQSQLKHPSAVSSMRAVMRAVHGACERCWV